MTSKLKIALFITLFLSFSISILLIVRIRLENRIDACFEFDNKTFEKIKELNKNGSVLETYIKRKFREIDMSTMSAHLPSYYFYDKNEIQLFTKQEKPFCIFIQNIFFSVVLEKLMNFGRFDQAFNKMVKNGDKMTKKEKFDYIKNEVDGVFVPLIEFGEDKVKFKRVPL